MRNEDPFERMFFIGLAVGAMLTVFLMFIGWYATGSPGNAATVSALAATVAVLVALLMAYLAIRGRR